MTPEVSLFGCRELLLDQLEVLDRLFECLFLSALARLQVALDLDEVHVTSYVVGVVRVRVIARACGIILRLWRFVNVSS